MSCRKALPAAVVRAKESAETCLLPEKRGDDSIKYWELQGGTKKGNGVD